MTLRVITAIYGIGIPIDGTIGRDFEGRVAFLVLILAVIGFDCGRIDWVFGEERFLQMLAITIGIASCSQEQAGYTEQERVCIAQRYTDYDAKRLSQCVDVCKACLKGTVATCNTSCKLKGAS